MTDLPRRGIVLAGGTGSRLHPITQAVSKQLLPVYDKPMIYYPISTLLLAGIDELMIITTPHDQPQFERLLGDGSQWGTRIVFAVQDQPRGLAEALIIAEDFLAGAPSCLILGDNLFYGSGFSSMLRSAAANTEQARIFAQQVSDPQRYGIVEIGADETAISLEEKPAAPKSNWAITGLYFFPPDAPAIAADVRPSPRGELEITSVLQTYLADGRLLVEAFGRGFAWLDTGTFDSMVQASEFVRVIEKRQGLRIGSPEEIAFRMGLIDAVALEGLAERYEASGYGEYLRGVAQSSTAS